MGKTCMICGDEAEFFVKGTEHAYCKECASHCYSDLSCLQTAEEQAKELKKIVEQNIQGL